MSFASISFTMLFQANFLFHNHLFDKFSCSTPKHILLNYLPKYRFDHAMLPKNKPLVSSQHTHSPPPPSSLSLSNCSVGFSKSSKVWSLPNVHPTPYSLPCWPTCRSWSNHLDLLCFQTHSESFCWCLCLSYSLVLEGPSSHYLPVKFNSYLTSLKVNNKTQKLSKFHYSKLISVYYYSTLQYSILQCFVTVQSFH